jgi:glutathione reductase (NADPH)
MTPAEHFDVVILGGGNAGIGVTGPVRRADMSVASRPVCAEYPRSAD